MALVKVEGGAVRQCAMCAAEFVSRHSSLCLTCLLEHHGKVKALPAIFAPPVATPPANAVPIKSRKEPQAPRGGKSGRPRNAARIAQWYENHPESLLPGLATATALPRIRSLPSESGNLSCPLCGKAVLRGEMLIHKEAAHGERRVVPSPATDRDSGQYVHVHQGGLPSLGKRSR